MSVRLHWLLRRHLFAEAEALCRSKIQASPESPLYHQALARVLQSQGRFDEAIQEYRVAIGLGDVTMSAHRFDLVNLLLEAKRYDEVLAEAQKLLDPAYHQVSGLMKKAHEYMAYDSMYRASVALHDYRAACEAIKRLIVLQSGRGREWLLKELQRLEALL